MQDINGQELLVGDDVVAWGHGRLRPAKVTRIGRTNVTVELPMDGYSYTRGVKPAQVIKTTNPVGVAAQANAEATERPANYGRSSINPAKAFAAAGRLAGALDRRAVVEAARPSGAGYIGFPSDIEQLLASPSNRRAGPSLIEVHQAVTQLQRELNHPVMAAAITGDLPLPAGITMVEIEKEADEELVRAARIGADGEYHHVEWSDTQLRWIVGGEQCAECGSFDDEGEPLEVPYGIVQEEPVDRYTRLVVVCNGCGNRSPVIWKKAKEVVF